VWQLKFKEFQRVVVEWLKRNPGVYYSDAIARAVEEEYPEIGRIEASRVTKAIKYMPTHIVSRLEGSLVCDGSPTSRYRVGYVPPGYDPNGSDSLSPPDSSGSSGSSGSVELRLKNLEDVILRLEQRVSSLEDQVQMHWSMIKSLG